MALCPFCQNDTKEFFGDKCHNCNTEVSLGQQITGSIIYTTVQIVTVVAGVLFFISLVI